MFIINNKAVLSVNIRNMKRETKKLICDANEAVARVAHKTN